METITIPVQVVITLQNTINGTKNEFRYVVHELGIYGEWRTSQKAALFAIKKELKEYRLN